MDLTVLAMEKRSVPVAMSGTSSEDYWKGKGESEGRSNRDDTLEGFLDPRVLENETAVQEPTRNHSLALENY